MNTQLNCIFCQIVEGKAPARKLYEGDTALAIMDINGVKFVGTQQPVPGRVLIIPKRHVVNFYELNDDEAAECFILAKNFAAKIKKAFNPEFVDFIIRGGRVPHVHIILQAEFKENDPFNMMFRLLEEVFLPVPDKLLDEWFERLKEV